MNVVRARTTLHTKLHTSLLMIACSLALSACKEQAPASAVVPPPPDLVASPPARPAAPEATVTTPVPAPAPAPTPATPLGTDAWLGKWTGPEGTWLQLDGGAGRYTVTIHNLDSTIKYPATAALGEIHFDRAGAPATIRATDGAATGMKWLIEKKECLTLQPGEGYCRD